MEQPIEPELKRLPHHRLYLEHVSEATRLVERRRESVEVQAALEAQKEEYRLSQENVQRREDQLKRRDVELQEQLLKFNKFLVENDSKRLRMERRAAAERKVRVSKDQEIVSLKRSLEEQQRYKAKAKTMLAQHMRYQQYLEAVCEATEDFNEIPEITARWMTLNATYLDLVAGSDKSVSEIEKTRILLQHVVEEKTNEILNHNNKISELRKALEEAQRRVQAEQAALEDKLTEVSEKHKELGRILMACDNLFDRIMSPRFAPDGTALPSAAVGAGAGVRRAEISAAVAAANATGVNARAQLQLRLMKDYMEDLASIIRQRNGTAPTAAQSSPSRAESAALA